MLVKGDAGVSPNVDFIVKSKSFVKHVLMLDKIAFLCTPVTHIINRL